ncbi:glycosyltransferase [Paenibacillus favisporus]|uniref:glycosyltransferase n=1 Tax=Paenibacillus favisporus TaxID=221028 RepID=UPI003D2920DD
MGKTISLCMIVRNEEKVLERCLESTKSLVDEVIIVDTGSTDRTVDIAKKYTSDIYTYEWVNDFSAARNYSLQKATCDYILVLDADEYFESGIDLKDEISSQKDFYITKIQNHLSDGRVFTHSAIRLFVNDKRFFYRNRLHEHLNVTDPDLEDKLTRGDSQAVIHHTGYTDDIMIEKDKVHRNFELMKTEVEENPSGYNLYNMGKVLMNMDKYDQAIEFFRKAFPLAHGRMYQPELLSRLGYSLLMLKHYEQGIQVMNDAVKLYPEDVDIRNMQARLLMEGGYLKDAEQALIKCLEIGDKGISVSEGSGSYMANYLLSKVYEQQGSIVESYERIIKVIQEKPTFLEGIRHYLKIMNKANIPASEVFQSINSLYRITEVDHLQKLLDVLYHCRSSLLLQYLQKYHVNVQPNEQAVAYQYAGKYEEAKEAWVQVDSVVEENATDILFLAMKLNSESLLELAQSILNISSKEQKLLKKILNGEEASTDGVSSYFGGILLTVAEQAIKLQEFELFERIINLFLTGTVDMKYKASLLLHNYGFDKLAIEILMTDYNNSSAHESMIRLLGDICVKLNYFQDAVLFYSRLVQISNEYSAYERLFQMLLQSNELSKASELRQFMISQFPGAQWIRQPI